ncbi:LysR family glycine cleavage system transcriptional activator [Pseudomonas sp. BIGb0408]|uniref:LysR family glycine cleavage system transcriptional activator n=1 Tax=Phytopseudomonas flavescens TaxID=29435 RepID=A0A7Z0BQZ6_9GAMM|nr:MULTISPECIES: transcriptional regulator GcvA [Pseudomonas]MCW2291696.1 LysR family glycine cleavage system transcriptional activator [Pseudomonas sp. BIGb0408]NYH73733.1 LysR family glycine cleavage system transcriptional activator [Pseudomonas flavescens]
MSEEFGQLPSLNALRVFEVVARHLNFRLAAEELGVTQGAVAQQIRGLEADLGLRLFERQPRGLALTESGRSYSLSVRRAFELIADATQGLRPAPLHLTVSVTPTFASKWLIPRLPDFSMQHPQIDLRILASERLSSFHNDGVDVAVRYGRPPFGPGLQAELLLEQAIVAVMSPGLLERFGPPSDLQGLARYSLLHDAHNLWPRFLDLLFPEAPQATARSVRFNQTSLAIEAAIAGQGIALANRFFVARDIQAGRLIDPFDATLQDERGFYLLSPRRIRQQAPFAVVRTWLLEQTRDDR